MVDDGGILAKGRVLCNALHIATRNLKSAPTQEITNLALATSPVQHGDLSGRALISGRKQTAQFVDVADVDGLGVICEEPVAGIALADCSEEPFFLGHNKHVL